MTTHNLDGLLAPKSIALIGPSRHGQATLDHLLSRVTDGRVPWFAVKLPLPEDRSANRFDTIASLPAGPDLAIYLASPENLAASISELGALGTKAVLIPSPGFEDWPEDLLQTCREAAKPYRIRIIGPGSLGLAVPASGFDALISAEPPMKGDVAFLSRSSAVLNATLAWAKAHSIGFSAVVSLGARMDVDVGDLIDYLAHDHRTRAILLHVDTIAASRKFLSAARAAARTKPVIVLRPGRNGAGVGSTRTHAGRLATPPLVYEAAFRRAGMLQVGGLDEMFEAVDILSRIRVPRCNRVAVLTNGRSLGCLAADRIAALGDTVSRPGPDTLEDLGGFCRPLNTPVTSGSSQDAPIILREDLSREDLTAAVVRLLKDPQIDGALVLQAPSVFLPLKDIAEAIAEAAKQDRRRVGRRKALVAGLIGGNSEARATLDKAAVPTYPTPAEAARSLMRLARDANAREFLMAAPPSVSSEFSPDSKNPRRIVEAALAEDRFWLSPEEVCAVLDGYGIPIIATKLGRTADEAAALSEAFFKETRRCVVKLVSPDLPFKSQIDGVRLGLATPASVAKAAEDLMANTRTAYPDARIEGISVHPMLEDRHGLELYIGIANAPPFGPVLAFGHGGTAIEDVVDISLELPPLDLNLAHALIRRANVSRLLDGGKSRPRLDRDAIALALLKLSQITIDIPEIQELDINPIVARQEGLIALDARMTLCRPGRQPGRSGTSRLAIAPYPKEWEQTLLVKDERSVFVRPVRPDDEDMFRTFFEQVTPEDLRLRFFAPVREFSHKFLAQLTQLDYSRAMAFAALDPETGEMLGVVRLHADPNHETGEYAVIVRSDLKGTGLGWALMKLIIRYARADGIETVKGEVLKENTSMLAVCGALGFAISTSPDDNGVAVVTLKVADLPEDA